MAQILYAPAPRKTFSSQLGLDLARGLSEGFEGSQQSKKQNQLMQSENEALKKQGIDLAGINDPKVRQLLISERLKEGKEKTPTATDLKEKKEVGNLEGALDALSRMENLTEEGNLGFGTSLRGLYNPKVAEQAGEYEQLGKSLIQYASNIPIRNRQEFETLAHDLYDPTIRDAKRKGILKSMRRIIENSLRSHGSEKTVEENKSKRPLSTFMRKNAS